MFFFDSLNFPFFLTYSGGGFSYPYPFLTLRTEEGWESENFRPVCTLFFPPSFFFVLWKGQFCATGALLLAILTNAFRRRDDCRFRFFSPLLSFPICRPSAKGDASFFSCGDAGKKGWDRGKLLGVLELWWMGNSPAAPSWGPQQTDWEWNWEELPFPLPFFPLFFPLSKLNGGGFLIFSLLQGEGGFSGEGGNLFTIGCLFFLSFL